MTHYRIWTRIKHFFTAKHWRGAAIHSPIMYNFVRQHALKYRGQELIDVIEGALVVDRVGELPESVDVDDKSMVILREPFGSGKEKREFEAWYDRNHCVTAHFQGLIVIFFDKKLQKQQYVIRN